MTKTTRTGIPWQIFFVVVLFASVWGTLVGGIIGYYEGQKHPFIFGEGIPKGTFVLSAPVTMNTQPSGTDVCKTIGSVPCPMWRGP